MSRLKTTFPQAPLFPPHGSRFQPTPLPLPEALALRHPYELQEPVALGPYVGGHRPQRQDPCE